MSSSHDHSDVTKDIAAYKAIIVKHLQTKGWVSVPPSDRADQQVVIAFWDTRDALKVYEKLSISSIRFSAGGDLVQLHCIVVSKDVVQRVSLYLPRIQLNLQLTGDGDEWDSLWEDSDAVLRIRVNSNFGVEANGFKVRTPVFSAC